MSATLDPSMSAQRCRICKADIPAGSGIVSGGRVDPLCMSCIARRIQAMKPAGDYQGRIQAVRDDVIELRKKLSQLTKKFNDDVIELRKKLSQLTKKFNAFVERHRLSESLDNAMKE